VVVSGLARGIDAAAHEGALESGTAAVLAGGVDELYPPENAELGAAIAARGCLVSERPPGFVAKAMDFPRRNRIISGLSLGVVVVEAEQRSGSLITARLAGEQGRDVFAVPGSPLDPRARGTNNLLREGAVLVEEAEDVLRVLGTQAQPLARDGVAEQAEAEPPCEADLDCIAALLSPTPVRLDDLARDAGLTSAQTAAALVELGLAGRAELLPGGMACSA
jgi:DNA processing protein